MCCSAKQFREGLNHLAPHLDAGLAMIIKQRIKAGAIERMDLVGTVDGARRPPPPPPFAPAARARERAPSRTRTHTLPRPRSLLTQQARTL